LAARQTTAEYAEQAGITPGTARWTLKRVLQKTGCRRQSELMLLLAASLAAIMGG
jgi:DNA-binding CsgD family transcriptional regulator